MPEHGFGAGGSEASGAGSDATAIATDPLGGSQSRSDVSAVDIVRTGAGSHEAKALLCLAKLRSPEDNRCVGGNLSEGRVL